jgi:hypothetical protein
MRQPCCVMAVSTLLAITGSARADLAAVSYSIENSSLLRIDPATGVVAPIGLTGFTRLNSLTMDISGGLFSVGRASSGGPDDKLISIDPATGAGAVIGTIRLPGEVVSVRGLAVSPDGSFYVDNAPQGSSGVGPHNLWRIDRATGVGTMIGSLGGFSAQSLDFGPDGQLYGWDFTSKNAGPQFRGLGLVRIDPATAAVTDVAPAIDSVDNTLQGMAFSADGNLYGIDGRLHVFDPDTGAVRAIRPLSSNAYDIRGIETLVPEPGVGSAAFAGAASAMLVRRRCRPR